MVAASLSELTGLDWDPADVQMTNGGFAAIAVALRTLLEDALTTRPRHRGYSDMAARLASAA